MRTLENMLAVAVSAVEDAERLFTDGLGAMPAHHKKQGDFATEVDLAIEALLRERLHEETGVDVYGEEAGGVYNAEATWIVDPIDGTSNYAAGNPSCAILVSLVLDDEPVVAVTSIPTLRTRLTAVKGGPVHLSGSPLPAIAERDALVAQVGFSSLGSKAGHVFSDASRFELLARLATSPLRPRITGSIGIDLGFTAPGIFDAAISFSPYVWDNAAGVLLVRSAGGVVTDALGQPWTPRSTGVVAGTASAHRLILQTMDDILNP